MDAEAERQFTYVVAKALRYIYRVHPADKSSTAHWAPFQRHFGKVCAVCTELKKDLVADVSVNSGPISFFFKTRGKAQVRILVPSVVLSVMFDCEYV